MTLLVCSLSGLRVRVNVDADELTHHSELLAELLRQAAKENLE